MKLRFSPSSVLAGLVVGVVLAGGVVWASGSIQSSGEQVCRTKAGYLRISSTGECRRSEVPVELPQGPQGEQGLQGEPGVDGRDGLDATAESVRCFQRLTRGVDLHGCQIPADDVGGQVNLAGANLSGATFLPVSRRVSLGASRGYGFCAIEAAGLATCWGGQGHGDPQPQQSPTERFRFVGNGVWASCGLLTDDSIRCWGSGNYGALDGYVALQNVKKLAVGDIHACALMQTGSVRCWGNNWGGAASVPGGLTDVSDVQTGGYFTCALRNSGSVACWGNQNWQTAQSAGILNPPADLPPFKSLAATYRRPCAIDINDYLHCWGENYSGAIDVPSDLGKVKSADGGDAHICAVTMDDRLRCWGAGRVDTLPSGMALKQMISGYWTVCVVDLRDNVKCFGATNLYGQLDVPAKLSSTVAALVDLDGAVLADADLEGLNGATLVGCGISGAPKALPRDWSVIAGCLVKAS